MYDCTCDGDETRLEDCQCEEVTNTVCMYNEGAGVRCQNGKEKRYF